MISAYQQTFKTYSILIFLVIVTIELLYHQISPSGRTGDFHMQCCQGIEVENYDFILGRLAYKTLRPVQDSGITILHIGIFALPFC